MVWSVRKNGLFRENKRIILAESAVVSRGLVRPCFNNASEVQGERRVEPVRTLLSRSLQSPLHLKCDGKVTTLGKFTVLLCPSLTIFSQPFSASVPDERSAAGFRRLGEGRAPHILPSLS